MNEISKALQAIIDNPDDLSNLPKLVAKVQELENNEEGYQTRINKLQEINRSYLAQIPIPGAEPDQKKDEEEKPTLEDAQKYLVETLGGNQ